MAALELKVEKLEEELAEERAKQTSSDEQNSQQPAVVTTARNMKMLLANGTFRGNIRITSDAELVVMLPLLEYVVSIMGDLYISGLSWLPSLDNILVSLEEVLGSVTIASCDGLRSLSKALPLLAHIGKKLTFTNNGVLELASLEDAFPSLETVDGNSLQNSKSDDLDADGTYTGTLTLSTDSGSMFVTKRALFKNVTKITKGLSISSLNFADLRNAFPLLAEVGENLHMSSAKVVWMDASTFPLLAKIGTSVSISSNPKLVTLNGVGPLLTAIGTYVEINSHGELKSIDGAFPGVKELTFLHVKNLPSLVSMKGAFRHLERTTAAFEFYNNAKLESIDGAFPALQTVGTAFVMYDNRLVTTIGTGFNALKSIIGRLTFYSNGSGNHGKDSPGETSFCQSAKTTLCTYTSSYASNSRIIDASTCC